MKTNNLPTTTTTEIANTINALPNNKPTVKKTVNPTEKKSIEELIKESEIDVNETLVAPPSVLIIDGVCFGSLGNFSCIIGKWKSRKTYFLSMLMGAAISKNDTSQRIISKITDSSVLHFDTEQSKYDTQKVTKRVVNIINSKEQNRQYRSFCLRPFQPKTKIEIIEKVIYEAKDVKLVIIDGIADLISGYNNEEEAIKIVNYFMKWTFELNIHIITIVHQNKGNENAKGHLGSFVMQKAETILSVTKDRDISIVETTAARGLDIAPISFSINEDDIPQFVDYTPPISSKRATDPFSILVETHKLHLKEIFKNNTELSRREILDKIQYTLSMLNYPCGNDKCRAFLTHYKEQNLITQEEKLKPYTLNF